MQQPTHTTRILIARHGEVDAVHRGTVYGRLDVPLSRTGLAQSAALARALAETPLDAVVSSGLQRAEAAAALVREGRGLERQDDERLLEIDRGDWAGVALADLEREQPDAYGRWVAARGAVAGPGGESPADVSARVVPALSDWASRHPGGSLLVVAHLWILRSAACHALGLPMERSPAVALQPGSVIELAWPSRPGGRPELVGLGLAPVPPAR